MNLKPFSAVLPKHGQAILVLLPNVESSKVSGFVPGFFMEECDGMNPATGLFTTLNGEIEFFTHKYPMTLWISQDELIKGLLKEVAGMDKKTELSIAMHRSHFIDAFKYS